MSGRRYKVALDAAGIAELEREVSAYRDGLAAKADAIAAKLADAGAATARAALVMPEGETAPTISTEKAGGGAAKVVAVGEHAAFVEFGVGVVGAGTYPGELPVAWPYDTRRTPYAHDPEDPTLWYYHDDYGEYRSTRGVAASAYMLAAAEEMRQQVARTAREVFA